MATPATSDEYDPMNGIEGGTITRGSGENAESPAKRARYKQAVRNQSVDMDLPRQPPEVFGDTREKRSIQLYIVDRRQIWLRIDDVAWAVKYLYTQHLLKGVPLIAPDSTGPEGAA